MKEKKGSNAKGMTLVGVIIIIIVLLIIVGIIATSRKNEKNDILTEDEIIALENDEEVDREKISLIIEEYKKESNMDEDFSKLIGKIMQEEWCEAAEYNKETGETSVIMKDCGHQYIITSDGTINLYEMPTE